MSKLTEAFFVDDSTFCSFNLRLTFQVNSYRYAETLPPFYGIRANVLHMYHHIRKQRNLVYGCCDLATF